MRRCTMLALVAGGILAVVAGRPFVRARLVARGSGIPKPVTGMFSNNMAYVRWGSGPKTLLVIPGGPGNAIPSRPFLSWILSPYRTLVDDGYTVWMVARKRDMPRGYSFADMADDYGQLIAGEFGGKVDLVIGISTGGQIGFYLAARHPDRFGHIVIAVAGYADSQRAKEILRPYAKLAGAGRTGEAMTSMFEVLYPSLPHGVVRILGEVMGRLALGRTHPDFANDVMVEAEAELACDARDVLPDISVPVLLVCGDRDEGFPREVYEETAGLIPDCTVRMYEGLGHMGVTNDKRFPQDVLDFVRRGSTAQRQRAKEQPAITDQSSDTSQRPVGPSPASSSVS